MYYRINDKPVNSNKMVENFDDSAVDPPTPGKKIHRSMLYIFYGVLTLLLALGGFYLGKTYGALSGLLLGIILSLVLWFAWGKKHSM